jgi:hypothetical protein
MKSLKSLTMNIRYTICLGISIFFACNVCIAQNGQNWRKDLESSMQKFIDCTQSAGEKYECSSFIGEAMAKVYKTDAFYSQKLSRYLRINEISKSMVENGQWTELGRAYEQGALEEAQKQANANKAVIAVYATTTGIGHIAVILPGKLQYSGSWGFHVPNAASFLFNDSEKSFVDKGLSYAFTKSMIKDVVLYSRK